MASSRIDLLLAEVKRGVRRSEVLSSLLLLAVLAVAFFVCEAVADRLLLLDRWVRFALFAGFGVFALAYLTVPLYIGLKRIRSLYAARLVEERHPELGESITTLLQAEAGEAVGAKSLVGPLRQRVERTVAPLDPRRQTDGRLLRWAGIALALAAVFAAAGAVAGGRGYVRCLARCVNPFRELLPPTRTVIARVEPGDAGVLRGKTVPVTAWMQGDPPADAKAYFSSEEGSWLFMALARGEDGKWSGTLPEVKAETRYFVLAGDTKSETHTLTPKDPPEVREVKVECRFPEYSGLGVRETSGGDIDALRGTRATVKVDASLPLVEAFLKMEDGTLLPMTVAHDSAQATFTVQKNLTYSVRLVAAGEVRNEEPPVYTVVARKDQPPTVRVTRPGRDLDVPADETLPLAISAADECGVEDLALVYQVKGGRQGRRPIRLGADRRNVVVETGLLPAAMGLKPGDVMLYYVEARDGAQPQPNRGASSLYLLTVKQPLGAQVAKPKADEKDKNEFKDRLTREEEAKLAQVERLLKQLQKPQENKQDANAEKGEKPNDRETDKLARRGEDDKGDEEADKGDGEEDAEQTIPYEDLPPEITSVMVAVKRHPGHPNGGH